MKQLPMEQLSKEQVLQGVLNRNFGEIELTECYEAIDIYAKQTAIAFAEWLEGSDYYCRPENTVTNLVDDKLIPIKLWYRGGQSVGGKSTEQLYKLYEQSLNQQ